MPKVLKDFIAGLNAEALKEVYVFFDVKDNAMEIVLDALHARAVQLGIE